MFTQFSLGLALFVVVGIRIKKKKKAEFTEGCTIESSSEHVRQDKQFGFTYSSAI